MQYSFKKSMIALLVLFIFSATGCESNKASNQNIELDINNNSISEEDSANTVEKVSVNKILNIEDDYKLERPLVKLDIKNIEKETITGYHNNVKFDTEQHIININDYKINLHYRLVEKGYTTDIKNDILTITSKDDSYQCVIFQLSDNYVMPTEEEKDAFYETAEYKALDELKYGSDLYWDKYDEISRKYYKGLGYTTESSPNYVLSDEEMLGKYNVVEESNSSVKNGLFPGYEYFEGYNWGNTTLYTIPKHYKDSYFGEESSDFSICLYKIECYDKTHTSYVDLQTY